MKWVKVIAVISLIGAILGGVFPFILEGSCTYLPRAKDECIQYKMSFLDIFQFSLFGLVLFFICAVVGIFIYAIFSREPY